MLIILKIFKGNAYPTISISLLLLAVFVFIVITLKVDQTALLKIIICGILFFAGFMNPTFFGFIAKRYPGVIAGLGGFSMGTASNSYVCSAGL